MIVLEVLLSFNFFNYFLVILTFIYRLYSLHSSGQATILKSLLTPGYEFDQLLVLGMYVLLIFSGNYICNYIDNKSSNATHIYMLLSYLEVEEGVLNFVALPLSKNV